MLIVDLVIAAVVVAGAYWGYREGLSTLTFALVGFAVGAILGSRVAPLILDDGLDDPFAPAISLPAAILLGAVLAAAFERLGYRLRLRVRRRSPIDVGGGILLAAGVGIVAVWAVGTAAAQVDSLRGTVRDSTIIEELNAALPPPGPLLKASERPTDPLPELAGPEPNVGPADPSIRNDRQVRRARRSVVKIFTSACDEKGTATGWVAGEGIVVTNAHVVRASDDDGVKVKVQGKGPSFDADTIWYDNLNDVAVLRAPEVTGVPKLRLDTKLSPGTYVAALGFRGGGPFRFTPGRMADDARVVEEDRTVSIMRALGAGPGSSGGPVVDRRGRVVTTVFGGRAGGRAAYGVPLRFIRRALRRAGPPVDTGTCLEE